MSNPFTSGFLGRRGYHHGNLREALIDAARAQIADKGVHGFTLAEITRTLGVSPASVYRHFPSREALVGEVAHRGWADFALVLARAAGSVADPVDAFRAMGRAYLAFARAEPGAYAAMFAPPAATGGPIEDPDGSGSDAFAALLYAIGRAMPKARALAADAKLVALQVWALSHGVAALESAGRLPAGPGMPTAEEVLAGGTEALVRGQSREV